MNLWTQIRQNVNFETDSMSESVLIQYEPNVVEVETSQDDHALDQLRLNTTQRPLELLR